MKEEEFRSFDVRLTDGRYFKNVLVCSEDGAEYEKEDILDNQYTNNDGEVINIEMVLYHINDDDCDKILATIHSDDIEYICNSYKDKEVI